MKKRQLLIEGVKEEIIEKIKKSEAKNDKVINVVEEMKKARVQVLRNDEQQIENKLVLKEGKVYVPKNENLRLEIIELHYNSKTQKIVEDNKIGHQKLLVVRVVKVELYFIFLSFSL